MKVSQFFRLIFPKQITRRFQPSPLLRSMLETPPTKAQLIQAAIAEHDALDCAVRGRNESLLPLKLEGERLTAAPLGLGYEEKPRMRSLSLRSLSHISITKMRCDVKALECMRMAAVQGVTVGVTYLDERGIERTDELPPPIEEREDAFLSGSFRIRIKWICNAWIVAKGEEE